MSQRNNHPELPGAARGGQTHLEGLVLLLGWSLQWAAAGGRGAGHAGVSPYTYSAPVRGSVIVNGGTVSAIAFSRDGVTFYTVGQTAGMFLLNAADQLRITYTVLPTVTFVPT
jgi:hypothetical protein